MIERKLKKLRSRFHRRVDDISAWFGTPPGLSSCEKIKKKERGNNVGSNKICDVYALQTDDIWLWLVRQCPKNIGCDRWSFESKI